MARPDRLSATAGSFMEADVPTKKLELELIAARNALRESEARFATLADALPHMVWSTMPDGFHDYFNARWYEFTGVPHGSTDGEGWNAMFHPDDRERAWSVWRQSLETGEPYEIEYRLRHRSGAYRWTIGRAMPMRGEDGQILRWIGTCTDIHEAKEQAQQVELLSRELSHRIKNIFAVIAGLIGLSARYDPAQKAFARELQARIAALGRAHELVRPSGRDGGTLPGTLHGILERILAPYPALGHRILISGDDTDVDDRAATPIGLLVHELATNATKYGALSDPEGRVDISTRLENSHLRLTWMETNGPPVDGTPDRSGFGTMLTDLSIRDQLGGTIDREWLDSGLRVSVLIAADRLSRG